ncbi:MAG: peptidoglycan DD-metalloendopeptidase family protein [Anaerolineales bacterium]
MLTGKGLFIWQIEQIAPTARQIVELAQQANLGFALVKIADGQNIYPINDPDGAREQLTREAIIGLQDAGIEVWGWTYIYGTNPSPTGQARRLIQRMHYFGLNGAAISTADMPDRPWDANDARAFVQTLTEGLVRAGIEDYRLALATHPDLDRRANFPFETFLEPCSYAMPHVYWAHVPGGDVANDLEQTILAYETFMAPRGREWQKEVIPIGGAYADSADWNADRLSVARFMQAAERADRSAVAFWSMQHALLDEGIWQAVADYPFNEDTHTDLTIELQREEHGSGSGESIRSTQMPPSVADTGEAIIKVGGPGFIQGTYEGIPEPINRFERLGEAFVWVEGQARRSTAYAQWVPRVPDRGHYEIAIYVPNQDATATVRYDITGVLGESQVSVERNQLFYEDEWVRLGVFELDPTVDFAGMVQANNIDRGGGNRQVCFGPVRWRKAEAPKEILPGYADGFDSPVGTDAERALSNEDWGPRQRTGAFGENWNGDWYDYNPYMNWYNLGGVRTIHTGIDLNLPGNKDRGAPTYAIASGEVIFATNDNSIGGFGNLIIIRHDPYRRPDGTEIVAYSRYAHIKAVLVRKGQRVIRGQKLGTVWNVGTVADHLHFDISLTNRFETRPQDWPGTSMERIKRDYTDPYVFIRSFRPPEQG